MSKKSLVLTIVAHQPYIRCVSGSESSAEIEMLFSAISGTYLPLLNMFERLDMDCVPFKVSMVLTPTLCALLADYEVQQCYVAWLDRVIELGNMQVASLPKNAPNRKVAKECLSRYKKNKEDFLFLYKSDLLSAFRYYADRGSIELLATCATSAFLPHYADIPEAVNAQIEAGLYSHRQFFGVIPEGFWFPAMGYVGGLEKVLRSYGFTYTMLDSHGLLFSEPAPTAGIFSPVRCEAGLVMFARDFSAETQTTGRGGFMWNPLYRDQDRDLAFESSADELKDFLVQDGARTSTGYKYWKRSSEGSEWYDFAAAQKQVALDADKFVASRRQMLDKAEKFLETSNLSLVCAFDARIFGQNWFEGVDWLEQVLRKIASSDDVETAHCSSLVGGKNSLPVVVPFMSAALGTGYGEDALDTSNDWMLRYSRKSCEQMVQLVERFPKETGLKERVLNTAARELLLAQAVDWPVMMHHKLFPDYAEAQFKKSIKAFTNVYDSLGSTSVSTEWLTNMEQEHPLFPWINYQIFSRKK